MFEKFFKSELLALNADPLLIDKLWKEIEASYGNSNRYYHNLLHLDHLIGELLPVKERIVDWQTIILAMAYHDIVYNTLRHDNEEKSANFAYDRLSDLCLPAAQKKKCKLQILSTKRHQLTVDDDTNYFTDADLSILGADNNVYLIYTQQIRREYNHFPDLLYKPGRKKVLNEFLEMEKIFKTEYFQKKYERRARINISSELKTLS